MPNIPGPTRLSRIAAAGVGGSALAAASVLAGQWWGPALYLATGIAVTTVGFKSFRAATANPVDSLRYE